MQTPIPPRRRSPLARVVPLLALLALFTGCGRKHEPAPGTSNLSVRDLKGAEVARVWLDLPKRLPGPSCSFGGTLRLVHARGDFPADATATARTGRYSAFVGENGTTLSFNLNPTVADNNVILAGQPYGDDEIRGQWSLSTFGGTSAAYKPRGTFVLSWPRK